MTYLNQYNAGYPEISNLVASIFYSVASTFARKRGGSFFAKI
jgi:hypothetical protein